MRHEGFAALFMLICCSNPDFIALTVEQEIIFLLAFNKVRMHIKKTNNKNIKIIRFTGFLRVQIHSWNANIS